MRGLKSIVFDLTGRPSEKHTIINGSVIDMRTYFGA